jgi:MFS family permease
LAIIPPGKKAETNPTLKTYFKSFLREPNRGRIIGIIVLAFLSFLLLYALIIYLPIHLTSDTFGLSEFWAGLFLAIQGITSGTAATQAKRISERFSRPTILGTGFVLMSIGLGIIFFSVALRQLIIGLLVFGSGFGSVQPQLNTWITEQVSHERRGGLVAVFNMLKYVGQTTAPLLFGFLLALVLVKGIFLCAAAIGIGAALLSFMLHRLDDHLP